MTKLLSIALGGAIGALLRYSVFGLVYRFFSGSFPWGTIGVNLIGSFLIGILWGIFEVISISENIRLFLFIGLLGSFTTFSTFSLENFNLIKNQEYGFVFFNVAISVIMGIGLVFVGSLVSRLILMGR